MNEPFLHYLWRYRKFRTHNLRAATGESITIIDPGQYLESAGPPFFNARIGIAGQKWAGNIAMHLCSSHWYANGCYADPAYENIILHITWEDDAAVFSKDHARIPTLGLKAYTPDAIVEKYKELMLPKPRLYCERGLAATDPFILRNWLERLLLEWLEAKSGPVNQLPATTAGYYEAAIFSLFAKNSGIDAGIKDFPGMAFRLLAAEIDSVAEKFSASGIAFQNASDSLSLLRLYNEYCTKGRCLECAIGIEYLKT